MLMNNNVNKMARLEMLKEQINDLSMQRGKLTPSYFQLKKSKLRRSLYKEVLLSRRLRVS